MASAWEDPPIPAELAVDNVPITDAEFDMLEAAVAVWSTEAGVDFESMLADVIARPWDGEAPGGAFTHVQGATNVAHWQMITDEDAEWALRKLAMAQEDVDRLRAQAESWQARIQQWFVQASRTHVTRVRLMEARLADYGRRRRDAGGGATLKLPSGQVASKWNRPTLAVVDESAFVEWLKAVKPEAVKTVESPRLRDIGDAAKVVEVEDGWTVRLVLGCGHAVGPLVCSTDEQRLAVQKVRGEMVPCTECTTPLDSEPAQVAVEACFDEARKRLAVHDENGQEVPGVTVKPGHVSITVRAS